MTCIVGLVDDGAVYMGGDSAGVLGLSIEVRADEKVFYLNEKSSWRTRLDPRELLKPVRHLVVMGFTSSFRMGQLPRERGSQAPPKRRPRRLPNRRSL